MSFHFEKGVIKIKDLYERYVGQPEPQRLECKCGWKGNKPRYVKFKKVESKIFCPNCGEQKLMATTDIIFWRTANGYCDPISFENLLAGRHGKKSLEGCIE